LKKNIFERKTLIIIFFLFLNLIIMSTNIVLKDNQTLLEYSIGSIISPIQIMVNSSTDYFKTKWEKYFFKKNIYHQYQKTKKKIFDLKKENYILKSRLDFLQKKLKTDNFKPEEFKIITRAKVISIDRNFTLNSIIINAGSSNQIKKDMVVINEEFDLVGKITDSITPFTSKVRLITSKIGGVGAHIESNEMEGFLVGNNNKVCSFKYLIESKPIEIGNIVLTSGTGGIFPEKLQIGEVKNITKGYLVQEIEVSPFFIKKPMNNLIVIERIK